LILLSLSSLASSRRCFSLSARLRCSTVWGVGKCRTYACMCVYDDVCACMYGCMCVCVCRATNVTRLWALLWGMRISVRGLIIIVWNQISVPLKALKKRNKSKNSKN
jgi:hypothetical protein